MRGKSKSKKRNWYNMKGCSKTKTKTRKNKLFLGGATDLNLAYPSKGPPSTGFNFLNPQTGGCNGQCAIVKGGAIMKGGKKSHTCNCSCKSCQKGLSTCSCKSCQKGLSTCSCKTCQKGGTPSACNTCQKGGAPCACQKGGAHLPYPNGLLGNAWTPAISGWPGVDGISMGRNHLGYNTYNNDVSRQMRDVGANPPFTYLKGGKRRKSNNTNNKRKSKTQKAGNNLLVQDLVNVGRQLQYGVGSAYNGIRGYTSPVNPLPWKDQFK
jgi:hypothetical protein